MFINCCLKSTIIQDCRINLTECKFHGGHAPPLHQLQILYETLTRCFDCYYNCVSWFSYHLLYSMALQPSSQAVEEQSLGSVQRRSRRLAVTCGCPPGLLLLCLSSFYFSLCEKPLCRGWPQGTRYSKLNANTDQYPALHPL